jgi:cytochrome c-type biogenesis protein CcmF
MRNPDIANLGTRDFYLAPLSLESSDAGGGAAQKSSFRPGESGKLGGLEVSFLGLDRPLVRVVSGGLGGWSEARAKVLVRDSGGSPEIVEMPLGSSGTASGGRYLLQVGLSEDGSPDVVILTVQDTQAGPGKDILVAEASLKPWINLVWSGFIILVIALMVTVYRRAREAARGGRSVEGDSSVS